MYIEIPFGFYLIIYVVFAGIFSLSRIKIIYYYYSSIQNICDKPNTFKSYMLFLLCKTMKKIYSISITLTNDCSYYYLLNAPRFHNLRFVKEFKSFLNELNVRLPQNLSANCLSFNIPKKKTIMKEFEFDLDLELPLSSRIKCWFFGIYIILFLMILSGIIYILFFLILIS